MTEMLYIVPSMRRYHTFIQRIAAAIIDGFILLPVSLLLGGLEDNASSTGSFVIGIIVNAAAWYSYSIFLHGRYGQTLGKMASKVKVYALDEKSHIGYQRAFMRELINICILGAGLLFICIDSLRPTASFETTRAQYDFFFFYASLASTIAELVTMFFNKKRRSIHDLVAGTVVLDITKYSKWDFEYERKGE